MERLPRRTPTAQMDIIGLVFDALEDLPRQVVGSALRALGDLVGETPIVGDTLEAIIDGVADIMLQTKQTAVEAQEAAETAQTVAANAGSKINFTEIYNFETAAVRTKYPVNGGNNGFGYVNNPSIAASGNWVLQLDPNTGYDAYANMALSEKVDVTVGESLFVEWKQRRYGTPNFQASIMAYFYDATDTFISYGNVDAVPALEAPIDEWFTYAAQIIVPANAVKADIRAVLFADAGITPDTGGWYIEDVVAGRMTPKAGVKGLTADLANATAIATAADAAVQGQIGVVNNHENRITYLESGSQVAEFNSNGTWTKPTDKSYHKAILIGGGGGGGGGRRTSSSAYGGGAGGWAEQVFQSVALTATVAITLGTGGNGGAQGTGSVTSGQAGTATSFGLYLSAGGGSAGGTNAPVQGTGTRSDFPAHGGRGSSTSGAGTAGGNGYLVNGGAGGASNTAGSPGGSPPPGQRGIGSGGGGGGGNGGGGTGAAGGAGGSPGGGGGGGGGATNLWGTEKGGAGGKAGNGKAWVVSSPGVIT